MNERLRQMERAKNFRQTRERISELALAVANQSLRSAEQKLAYAVAAEEAAAREAALAQEQGRRSHALMSVAIRKAFGFDRARFERERAKREEGARGAETILRERRIESEQAVSLHQGHHARLLEEAAKREQADIVERFLVRSRWSSAKVRVRTLTEAV